MSKQQKRNLKVKLTPPTRWALAKVGGRDVMEMLRESLDRSRDNPIPSELIPVSWPQPFCASREMFVQAPAWSQRHMYWH